MVTQAKIAEKAKVSRALVSHILNGRTDLSISEATRLRVLEISQQVGYKSPRRRECMISYKTLAVDIDPNAVKGLSNPYYSEMFQGAASVAEHLGYHFLLFPFINDQSGKKLYSIIKERRVEGVLSFGLANTDLLEQCVVSGLPISIVGSDVKRSDVDSVYCDTEESCRLAVKYLNTMMGHRNIAYLDRPKMSPAYNFFGTKDALKAAGLDSSFMIDFPEKCGMEIDREAGHLFALDFLKKRSTPGWNTVTVLYCSNDSVAMGVMDVFLSKGIRIPKDISVFGEGNILNSAKTFPPLSTINYPKYQIGKLSTEHLINRIENPEELPQRVALPVSIVERQSVAKMHDHTCSTE